MEQNESFIPPKFENPEDEVLFLRTKAEKQRDSFDGLLEGSSNEHAAEKTIDEYRQEKTEDVLHNSFQMKVDDIEQKILHMSSEHDAQIDQLALFLQEKGVKNTLALVQKMNNPHLEDDFHRFLVQFVAQGMDVSGIDKNERIFRALNMKLFEVVFPNRDLRDEKKFSEMVGNMEQFYLGMLSVAGNKEQKGNYFTLEITMSNFSEEVVFYTAVPAEKASLFEQQIHAVYPEAQIKEHKEDYNPFNERGVSAGSYATLKRHAVFPLKKSEDFDYDPLNVILSVFSKIKKDGEGAAIQVIYKPVGETYNFEYRKVLEKIERGLPVKQALETAGGAIARHIGSFARDMILGTQKQEKKEEDPGVTKETKEFISQKISSPILETNIRIVASAESEGRAQTILSDLESAFNQFTKQQSNTFSFLRVTGKRLAEFLYRFSFRLFADDLVVPLNIEELSTMFHFPLGKVSTTKLKQAKGATAPAPIHISSEGVVLGVNSYRGEEKEIRMGKEDRMRHLYTVGQTGTGKTTFLKNLIIQDIKNGEGVCMIDPHGSDIQDILANIPLERLDDVIYFDPAHIENPMGLNMLECDPTHPEQKIFVVNELFNIFQKLYGANPESMGPMFEQYFRNAAMLVVEDPQSGSTLLEVSRVLSDAAFRELKLSRCRNPLVVQFWREVAGRAGGEAALANIVPYITSKFDVFLANDIMRPIVAQERSAFNLRQVMDERKILLVNLSKGRLGDINAHLIGLILVGKILMAALSRVDVINKKPFDFFLYIDEFQNITTDSIATILSEARKYRLSLNVAHQFIAQLDQKIKDAVFGNVGSMAIFRVGAEDAEVLEKQLSPVFSAKDIMDIENYHAYMKLLVEGIPSAPFSIETLPSPKGGPHVVEKIKQLSYLKYGKNRADIEAEIAQKYQVMSKRTA